jgi:hypothetical protein
MYVKDLMNQWANAHYAIFTVKTTMPLTKGTYIHCFWENILYPEKTPKSSFSHSKGKDVLCEGISRR